VGRTSGGCGASLYRGFSDFGFRVSIGPGEVKSSESVSGFGFRSSKPTLKSRLRVSGFDRSWGSSVFGVGFGFRVSGFDRFWGS